MEKNKNPSPQINKAEQEIFTEETKKSCLGAMLLCLNRMQRMVFILGPVFNIDSKTAARLLDISPLNFRKILSQSRKLLVQFMDQQCGLFNSANPCRCSYNSAAAVRMGIIKKRRSITGTLQEADIDEIVSGNMYLVDNALMLRMQNFFRELPIYHSPSFGCFINKILQRKDVSRIIKFNDG